MNQPSHEDQMIAIKKALIDEVSRRYKTFMDSISNFPVPEKFKTMAFQYFDTGFLWFEKGLAYTQIQTQAVQAPIAPPQEENKVEESDLQVNVLVSETDNVESKL